MTEVAYYPEVECRAIPSTLHDTQVVTVKDAGDGIQSLRVAAGFLTEEAGKIYLPVRVIDVERKTNRVLVELPYEADSGANRLWVLLTQFRRAEPSASKSVEAVA